MELNLNSDQRAQLELIALHEGKTPGQALTEAALFLLIHDVDSWEWMDRNALLHSGQAFLTEEAMEARLAEICGRRVPMPVVLNGHVI